LNIKQGLTIFDLRWMLNFNDSAYFVNLKSLFLVLKSNHYEFSTAYNCLKYLQSTKKPGRG